MPSRASIYLVMAGEAIEDRVELTPVVGFRTRRVAETVVRKAKREDAYTHQYDTVQEIKLYSRETDWKKGQKIKAKRWEKTQ